MLPTKIWEKQAKVIQIIRDPRDVAVSYYNFFRTFDYFTDYYKKWDNYFEKHFSRKCFYGSWFDYINSWKRMVNLPNVHLLSYEELKDNPRQSISNIAKFLGKSLSDEQLDFIMERTRFETMKSNPACNYDKQLPHRDSTISPFMRKGEVGDWKNKFTVAQAERFIQMYKQEADPGGFDGLMRDHRIYIE